MHWSPAIGAEHRATRERAGLFDESSFAKLEISGPGAAGLLERLCDNRVAREVGAITYTQMLNRRGGIECDFTVTRTARGAFSIVTGTAFGDHDLAWIRSHAPSDGSVRCADVTARWSCFALWGPLAREILAPLTDDPLDFGYMRMRDIAVGDVPVRALRVTFVGELGWELYCPTEYGAALWRTLWEAGREHGMLAGGYRAIDSLRLEKGYRVWAADITADETPLQAGLGFCVKDGEAFLGGPALRSGAAARRARRRRLRCVVLADPRSVALGNEPVRVRRGGRRARHQRRLRLHRRALDRLRLHARRAGSRDGGRDRHLRPVGPRRGGARAAVRPQGRARSRLGSAARGPRRGAGLQPRATLTSIVSPPGSAAATQRASSGVGATRLQARHASPPQQPATLVDLDQGASQEALGAQLQSAPAQEPPRRRRACSARSSRAAGGSRSGAPDRATPVGP